MAKAKGTKAKKEDSGFRLSAPEYILGVDLSLEHTGYALYNVGGSVTTGILSPNGHKGMARLSHIRELVTNLSMYGIEKLPERLVLPRQNGIQFYADPTRIRCLVLVESYAFARANQAHQLGELGGVVRLGLHDAGIAYLDIAPAMLKKFVTGKGSAPKDVMIKEVYKRFGFDTNDNNIADAYSLMSIGRAITNTYDKPLVQFQTDVVIDLVTKFYKENSNGK